MSNVHLSHPSAEQLAAFVAGRLDKAERQSVESHVAGCEVCARALENRPAETLASLSGTAGAERDAPPSKATFATSIPQAHEIEGIPPGARPAGPQVPPELAQHPRYRVLGLLGAGGMGAVYKAEHRLMERPVALKVISRALLDNPEAVERFHRETRAAARLAHPNIVTAYDAEQAGDVHFLVMEFVDGASLARLVEQRGPLPVPQACDYVRQVALGLQHAHERGMVHRDIKPHNLMLTPEGQVKVLDFGLARFVAESTPAGALTKTGSVMGTPDYMAPEQALKTHTADVRADIYALGCTFYHLLTGQPPFPGGSLTEKLLKHQQAEPQPVADLRPEVPHGLAAVLHKMLAKRPDERFQAPAAVAEALAPFALAPFGKGDTPVARPTAASVTAPLPPLKTPKARLPRWWMPPAGAAAVLLLVVAAILVIRNRGGDEVPTAQHKHSGNKPPADKPPADGKDSGQKPVEADVSAAVKALLPGLGDKDTAVRRKTVVDLCRLSDKTAVPALAQCLSERDARVRREAARCLRMLGDKAAVPALRKRVADDTWGETHGPFATLRSDTPYEDVAAGSEQGSKYAALEALRELAPDKVTAALLAALQSKTPAVAAWAIRNLGGAKANGEVVKAVAEQLAHKDARVRREAARCLRMLGDKAAVPALRKRVADDTWGETKGRFPELANDNPYEDVETGRNQGSKYAALEALKKLAPQEVTRALGMAQQSSKPDVQKWATKELERRKDSK